MKQTPYQPRWAPIFGTLSLFSIILFFLAFSKLSIAESTYAPQIGNVPGSRQILRVESTPSTSSREVASGVEERTPTKRQASPRKTSTRERNRDTETLLKKKDNSYRTGRATTEDSEGGEDYKSEEEADDTEETDDTVEENATSGLKNAPRQAIYDLFPPGLTLFGHDLFVNTPNSFIPETNIPIPADYRMGPGDSVLIQLSGRVFQQHAMTIDREGILTFPNIGPLPVAGMRFQELKEMLQERVQEQLLSTKVARVTLGALRSLQVFILGDVPHPGSYTVNSLTTGINALFSSGGIKPIGSLRNIQIKRGGETITTLDLYALLLRGDQSADVRLQSSDIIFVPPIGSVIAITGRVKRPGIYEILTEKTMEEGIALAGGLLPDADPAHIKLDRFQSQTKRILLDIDLTHAKQQHFQIQSGDTIQAPSIPRAKANIVTLSGSVANPGEYQWHEGQHLTDIVLFQKLLPQVDLSYAIITRLDIKTGRLRPLTLHLGRALEDPSSPDNIVLQPGDAIQIFGLAENRAPLIQPLVGRLQQQARFNHREQVVNLAGHVRFPGSYPFSPGMGLKNLIHAAGDIKVGTDMTYALIVRSDKYGKIEPFSIQLSDFFGAKKKRKELVLQPKDTVLVFPVEDAGQARKELLAPILSKLHLQGSAASPAKTVQINGAVYNPGEYPLEPDMRASDLIRAAGNMLEPAYTLDAEVSRYTVLRGQSREINHFKVELDKIAQGNSSSDILLQPHDILQVKRIPQWSVVSHVTLTGEIRFPGTYPIKPGETLFQALERAGGLTPHAYPEGAIFLRESLRQREESEINSFANRLEMELTARNLQSQELDQRNRYLIENLVQRLRSTTPQGRLAIDLPSLLAKEGKEKHDSILLKDKDRLFVPQKTNEITVLGEVFYPTSHQFLREKTTEDYINLSGGYNLLAEPDHIYVVKASGQVVPKRSKESPFGLAWLSGGRSKNRTIDISPGDTIVVPLKGEPPVSLSLEMWKDITSILYNLAVTSSTLKTLGGI